MNPTRIFHPVFDAQDASFSERTSLFADVPQLLYHTGFWGHFMYEVEAYGYGGYYVHNILAYALEYGFIPFALLLLLLSVALLSAVRLYKRGDALPLALVLFVVISVLFSRSHVWPLLWFGLSFVVAKEGAVREVKV